MTQVQIVPRVLKQQVEEGWKLKPLAEHYGLPEAQMKQALKALGLQIRKFHAPKFVFVDETIEDNAEQVLETIVHDAEEIVPEISNQTQLELESDPDENVALPQDTYNGGVTQENW
jgi:hypothetical protein